MKCCRYVVFFLLSLLLTGCREADIHPTHLRCEYLVEPIGIDARQPRLSWLVQSTEAGLRGQRQTAYRILVASSKELLEADRGDRWDSLKTDTDQTAQIVYDGPPLTSSGQCWWKVRVWDRRGRVSDWSEPARWTMGLLKRQQWRGKWIGEVRSATAEGRDPGDRPRGVLTPDDKFPDLSAAPYLRKEFSLSKPIRRAVVSTAALGLYELSINGLRVGKDHFTPGWPYYPKRVYYNTYEVTDLLRQGENAIGAIIADGWYCGYLAWKKQRDFYGDKPRLISQLVIEYEDGSSQSVVTDESWRTASGPILEADFYMGESYDAQREMTGWNRPGFDDSKWTSVEVEERDSIAATFSAYPCEPVRKVEEIRPVAITEPSPGTFIFDLGQNMVGWAKLKAEGPAGTRVVLRFAEMLNPDGTLYTENLRTARATDTYVLSGKGMEQWEPRFTYHGFRYVEVTGYPGRPTTDTVTGVVLHNSFQRIGQFECSNALVNQIYHNLLWGQRGNMLEVPTDCPQRDERMGWTGDAQVFLRTATYNMDEAAFFAKWLETLNDSQKEDGVYPHVAPDVRGKGDAPGWGDAGIICPYQLFQVYGDKRVIERHFDAMARYIEHLRRNSKEFLRPAIGFGDWVAAGAETPKELIATAYFAHVCRLMAEMATVVGRPEQSKEYEELFENVKAAFNRVFVSPDGRILGDTQTAYVLALSMDLLPEEKRRAALDYLVADIEKRGGHLSTGFLGTKDLLPVLTRFDRSDVAYQLLTNETYPSWGFEIKHGATTIWERWDGWTPEQGFQNPRMNSFNHYAFGAVGEWLFASVAGIEAASPGFKCIRIQPQLPPDDLRLDQRRSIDSVRAHYDSIQGRIETHWWLEDEVFHLNVAIPANTTAVVYVPALDPGRVTESGKPIRKARGVEFQRMESGAAVYKVGSGRYQFRSERWQ